VFFLSFFSFSLLLLFFIIYFLFFQFYFFSLLVFVFLFFFFFFFFSFSLCVVGFRRGEEGFFSGFIWSVYLLLGGVGFESIGFGGFCRVAAGRPGCWLLFFFLPAPAPTFGRFWMSQPSPLSRMVMISPGCLGVRFGGALLLRGGFREGGLFFFLCLGTGLGGVFCPRCRQCC